MKNTLFLAVLASLLGLSCFGFAGEINGVLVRDTQWTLADSPVTITDTLYLLGGATLTIEENVEVHLANEVRVTIAGNLVAQDASFTFGVRSSMVVSGGVELEGCTLDGLRRVGDAEVLQFEENASGTLTQCDLLNLHLLVAQSNLTIDGGTFKNIDGPVLLLTATAGDAPIVRNADFSNDTYWLAFQDFNWLAQKWYTSFATRFSNNTFASENRITVAQDMLENNFLMSAQLPFSPDAPCAWKWEGGEIAAGHLLTIAENAQVAFTNNTVVEGNIRVQGGGLLGCAHNLAFNGDLEIHPDGIFELQGNVPTATFSGGCTLWENSTLLLDGVTTCSGVMNLASGAKLLLDGFTLSPNARIQATGIDLEVQAGGLHNQGSITLQKSACQLVQNGAINISGTMNMEETTCSFTPQSAITVERGAFLNATEAVFNGAVDGADLDVLSFLAGSTGTLNTCDVHDLRLRLLSSSVTIQGGTIENSDGPAVQLLMNSGSAPVLSQVDFSQDENWLYVENVSWFVTGLNSTFSNNLSGLQVPEQTTFHLGTSDFVQDFSFPDQLPFTNGSNYSWSWGGGKILEGVTLTVPAGITCTVEGSVQVDGTLAVQPEANLDIIGEVAVSGELTVTGSSATKATEPQLRCVSAVSISGTLQIVDGGSAEVGTCFVEADGEMLLQNAQLDINFSGVTVEGTLSAVDSQLRFLQTAGLYIVGEAILTRSQVDIYNYNTIEVWGTLDAQETLFDGVIDSREPDAVFLYDDSSSTFTLCRLPNLRIEVEGEALFELCELSNPNGGGVIARDAAKVTITKSNLTDFRSYAIEQIGEAQVTADANYWGSPSGPVGEGLSGSGEAVLGTVSVPTFAEQAYEYTLPKVLQQSLAQYTGPFRQIDLSFNALLDPATFTEEDVVLSHEGESVPLLAITQQNDSIWRLSFAEQTAAGEYLLQVGPHIATFAGLEMDQDDNGVSGEGTDIFQVQFELGYPPEAAFSVSQTEACVGVALTFTDSSSHTPTEWLWDFGDSAQSILQQPEYAYSEPGVYTVSLTVRNPFGEDQYVAQQYIQVADTPQAMFITDQSGGGAPLTVQFTDKTTGIPATWSWDFGDGAVSNEANPTHTYTEGGTYTVRLRTSNHCGEDLFVQKSPISVQIVNPPDAPAALTASDKTYCDYVALAWQPVATANQYNIYRDNILLETTTATTYNDTTATPGTSYLYTVSASNGVGEGQPGSGDSGTRDAPGASPENLRASDGQYADAVRISWTPQQDALGYQVYRASTDSFSEATAVGPFLEVTANSYDDTEAAVPNQIAARGCFDEDRTEFVIYYYWVLAQYTCGDSAPGVSESGYRGLPEEEKAWVYPMALPDRPYDEVTQLATTDSALAVRLHADASILPETVWGVLESSAGESTRDLNWAQLSESDGWVLYALEGEYPAGTLLTLTAGASTTAGSVLPPVSYDFMLVQPEEDKDNTFEEMSSLPWLSGAVGDAIEIGQGEWFDTPRQVYLPLPDEIASDELQLYYCLRVGAHATWHPASHVAGWIVPDTLDLVQIEGKPYLTLQINHGAVVQFALPQEPSVTKEASVFSSTRWGDVLVLLLLFGVLLSSTRHCSVALTLRNRR